MTPLRVLIACECSGTVRSMFRSMGHDAWSCDLLPAEDGDTHHLQADCLDVARETIWDLMVAHPPCEHLSNAGARYWAEKRADGRQQRAIDFVLALSQLPIDRWCIENPPGVLSTVWRKPDQIVHPWMFGEKANKPTALWLKGLPRLIPTQVVDKGEFYRKANGRQLAKWSHIRSGTKDADRARIASRTFRGIAFAMATQWGASALLQAA